MGPRLLAGELLHNCGVQRAPVFALIFSEAFRCLRYPLLPTTLRSLLASSVRMENLRSREGKGLLARGQLGVRGGQTWHVCL